MFGKEFVSIVAFSVIVAGIALVLGLTGIKASVEADIGIQQTEMNKKQLAAEMAKPAVSEQAATTTVVENSMLPINGVAEAISEGNDRTDEIAQEILSPSYIYVAPAMIKAMSSGQE